MRTLYAVLWACWAGAFIVIEASAFIVHHPDDTLSDFVWRWEGGSLTFSIARFVVAAFCVWLAGHLIFRWWA